MKALFYLLITCQILLQQFQVLDLKLHQPPSHQHKRNDLEREPASPMLLIFVSDK